MERDEKNLPEHWWWEIEQNEREWMPEWTNDKKVWAEHLFGFAVGNKVICKIYLWRLQWSAQSEFAFGSVGVSTFRARIRCGSSTRVAVRPANGDQTSKSYTANNK